MDYSAKDLMEMDDTYGAHNYKPLDVILNKGEGVWVWDVEGNKYMDMLSSYSALNHGHRNPVIIKKMKDAYSNMLKNNFVFIPLIYDL